MDDHSGRAPQDRRVGPGRVSFLGGLNEDDRAALHRVGIPKRYDAGGTLFRRGDRSDHVVVLTAGRVKLATLHAGVGEVVLDERRAGNVLGELAAIDGRARTADAVAVDEVTALLVPNEDFHAFLLERPQAAMRLLELLTARLRYEQDHAS